MRALVRILPLVLLLFSPILFVSAENSTFTIPYDIPDGYVNDIRISYSEDQPFEPIQVQEFPEYFYNYTVEAVGWLEISWINQTVERPVLTLNDESVYAQMNPFYRERVFPGDFFEIKLVPPQVLESSHESVQDDRIVTRYKLYRWDEMSGAILFNITPRIEIIPDFTFIPETPVEDDSLQFTPLGVTSEIDYVTWEIQGPDFYEDTRRTKYVSPRLEAGKYNVTLTFVDNFGFSKNITKTLQVQSEPEEVEVEPDLGFTYLTVSNVQSPSSSMINEKFEVNYTLDFIISDPKEIRLRVIEVESGGVLSSLEETLETNGSKVYEASILASAIPRPMILRIDVYHDELGTWVKSTSSPAFTVDLEAPEQSNEIPGFPLVGLWAGLVVFMLLKRRFLAGPIPSPC